MWKGFRKIYEDDELIFEGEFSNGTITGEGKEFDYDGNIIFEGQYLMGERTVGKEYYNKNLLYEGTYIYNQKKKGNLYINNRLEFIGEFINDKKWDGEGYAHNGKILYILSNGNGKVNEYDNSGQLLFEGEYLKGKRNGMGKEYKYGELIYEGEFQYGIRHGKGRDFLDGELIFVANILLEKDGLVKEKILNMVI